MNERTPFSVRFGCAVSAVCLLALAAGNFHSSYADRVDRLRLREIAGQSQVKIASFKFERSAHASTKGPIGSAAYRQAEADYKKGDGARAYNELEKMQNEWRDLIWRHPDWGAMFNMTVLFAEEL